MDYEKAYKEALERAKGAHNSAKSDKENGVTDKITEYTIQLTETIFPELAESEDERIRKKLLEELYKIKDGWQNGLPVKDIIAYLEKQKEQVPYIDFVIKPHKGDDNNPYDMSFEEAQSYISSRGFDIPWNDGDVFVDERYITQTISNILRWADEHLKEQKEQKNYNKLYESN